MTPAEWLESRPLKRPVGSVIPRRMVELIEDVESDADHWYEQDPEAKRLSNVGESEYFRL